MWDTSSYGTSEGGGRPAGSAEPGEANQRQADGGGDPADDGLCTCGGHPAPIMGTHAEHHQVVLYLDPDAFTSSGQSRHTHLEAGTRVSLETVRRLTYHTSVVPGRVRARRR